MTYGSADPRDARCGSPGVVTGAQEESHLVATGALEEALEESHGTLCYCPSIAPQEVEATSGTLAHLSKPQPSDRMPPVYLGPGLRPCLDPTWPLEDKLAFFENGQMASARTTVPMDSPHLACTRSEGNPK